MSEGDQRASWFARPGGSSCAAGEGTIASGIREYPDTIHTPRRCRPRGMARNTPGPDTARARPAVPGSRRHPARPADLPSGERRAPAKRSQSCSPATRPRLARTRRADGRRHCRRSTPAGLTRSTSAPARAPRMTVSDVLVGDVFLCSGQSNMELSVGQARGGAIAAARSANDRIRLLTIPKAGSPLPPRRSRPRRRGKLRARRRSAPSRRSVTTSGAKYTRGRTSRSAS